jgi:hypothetical protein
MGRHSDEFGDIRGKSPQPNPSLERGNLAELCRTVRATVLILQIIRPLQTAIQRPGCLRCDGLPERHKTPNNFRTLRSRR